MAKRSNSDRDLSDDAAAFRAAMHDVKPLPPQAERAAAAVRRRRPRRAAQADADVTADMPLVDAHVDAAAGV